MMMMMKWCIVIKIKNSYAFFFADCFTMVRSLLHCGSSVARFITLSLVVVLSRPFLVFIVLFIMVISFVIKCLNIDGSLCFTRCFTRCFTPTRMTIKVFAGFPLRSIGSSLSCFASLLFHVVLQF